MGTGPWIPFHKRNLSRLEEVMSVRQIAIIRTILKEPPVLTRVRVVMGHIGCSGLLSPPTGVANRGQVVCISPDLHKVRCVVSAEKTEIGGEVSDFLLRDSGR